MKAMQDRFIQLSFDGFNLNFIDYFLGETIRQQISRKVRMEAATEQIKALLLRAARLSRRASTLRRPRKSQVAVSYQRVLPVTAIDCGSFEKRWFVARPL
jgi:hypothetical protein